MILNHVLLAGSLTVVCVSSAWAAPVTVFTDVDSEFIVKRETTGSTAVVQGNLHVKQSSNNDTDRFALIRFDSSEFGSTDVVAASFKISATTSTGAWALSDTFTFTVHGVLDGDAEDEVVNQNTYNPVAPGTLFIYSDQLIDLAQVETFGTFDASNGDNVTFTDPDLLSFIQNDANGIVTLVITRNTSGNNSVFLGSEQANAALRPQLLLDVVPEPSSLALLGLGGLLIARRRR